MWKSPYLSLPERGEDGKGLLSSPDIPCTPQPGSSLGIPTLDVEVEPTTFFSLPGNHLLSKNLFGRKHKIEDSWSSMRKPTSPQFYVFFFLKDQGLLGFRIWYVVIFKAGGKVLTFRDVIHQLLGNLT